MVITMAKLRMVHAWRTQAAWAKRGLGSRLLVTDFRLLFKYMITPLPGKITPNFLMLLLCNNIYKAIEQISPSYHLVCMNTTNNLKHK